MAALSALRTDSLGLKSCLCVALLLVSAYPLPNSHSILIVDSQKRLIATVPKTHVATVVTAPLLLKLS